MGKKKGKKKPDIFWIPSHVRLLLMSRSQIWAKRSLGKKKGKKKRVMGQPHILILVSGLSSDSPQVSYIKVNLDSLTCF